MKLCLIIASFLAIAAINVNGQDSGQLLMGTLVRQGSDKNEALGDIPPEDAEEVKVHDSKIFHFEFEYLLSYRHLLILCSLHKIFIHFREKRLPKGKKKMLNLKMN